MFIYPDYSFIHFASMKRRIFLVLAALAVSFSVALADDLPVTVLAKPGKLLVTEDFSKPLPPPEGSTAQFASGFHGWRCNVVPRGGKWEVTEGTFKGVETPEVHHPATASIGFDFKDVVIQCEVRMHDVPMDGRARRFFMVRTTDEKDYVCSVILDESGWRIQKDDNDHGGPDKAVPLGQIKTPIKLGEWQKVVFEIRGDEMAGTVNGQSLTGRHPLIASGKKSIMFVSGVEGSVRNLRVWEAK
jgi:hypothetical protein